MCFPPYLAHLLAPAFVAGSRHLRTFPVRVVRVELFSVLPQTHGNMCHLLRRVRWSLLGLEMGMRALQGSHWRRLLVLVLLWAGMHDLIAELLELLLQLQVRIGQVLVLLLRGWCAIVIAVRARSSTHLSIWVAIVRSHFSRTALAGG